MSNRVEISKTPPCGDTATMRAHLEAKAGEAGYGELVWVDTMEVDDPSGKRTAQLLDVSGNPIAVLTGVKKAAEVAPQ